MSLEIWCPLRLEASAARRAARSAIVARTGAGPRRAAAFADRRGAAGEQAHAGAVVLGLGGAITDDLAPGDVIVADTVRGPGPDHPIWGPASEAIVSRLQTAGIAAVRGPVRSVAHRVRGAGRNSLATDGTLAVDMESWWLLAAEPRPLAVVRVICDAPRAELVSLSLPWRVRRSLVVLSRIAQTLDTREAFLGQDIRRGLENAASGGIR